MKNKKIYAVYKGEKFLFEGTAKQCARYFNVKEKTIKFWTTKSYFQRINKPTKKGKERNCKLAIVIEEEENEEI